MPYVAPSTKSSYTTLSSTDWNTIVNDIIDLNLRIAYGPTASRPAGTVGMLYYDTNEGQLYAFQATAGGNAWQPLGNYVTCTSTTRPSAPQNGEVIYETNTNKLYRYNTDAVSWIEVTNGYPTLTTAQLATITSAKPPSVGAVAFDSTTQSKKMYTATGAGSLYLPFGNYLSGTYAQRPSTPHIGQLYYQTDTDEILKYVTDLDGQNRWMQADHDARRNVIVNGGFEINERKVFSINPVSTTVTGKLNYGPDHWQCLQATTSTFGFIPNGLGDPLLPNSQSYMNIGRSTGETFTTPYTLQQSVEFKNTSPFLYNKPMTLSFWAKKAAGFTASSSIINSKIIVGASGDEVVGAMTTQTNLASTNHTLTTSWQRFVVTVPTTAFGVSYASLGISFSWSHVGTAPANDYCSIGNVQLEMGTAPSDFEVRNYIDELARCRRYFHALNLPSALSLVGYYGMGQFISATQADIITQFPQPMFATPTAFYTRPGTVAGGFSLKSATAAADCSALPTFQSAGYSHAITRYTTATAISAVAGQVAYAGTGSAALGQVGWSGEMG